LAAGRQLRRLTSESRGALRRARSTIRLGVACRRAAPRRGGSAWLLGLALIAAAVLPATTARALDPAKSVFQFNCQNWTRQSGLPGDKVNAILQAQDGYLWLGTQNGLIRFDGLEFSVRSIDLPEARGQEVRKLALARDGGIWFAVEKGGVGWYDGRSFRAVANPALRATTDNALSIFQDSSGLMWAGTEVGLYRWSETGNAAPLYETTAANALTMVESAAGEVWIGTAEHGLGHGRASARLQLLPDEELSRRNIWTVAVDHGGHIWLGTGQGVRCYDAGGRRVPLPGLEEESKAILVDRHGTVWIGTTGRGLARYRDGVVSYLSRADGLAGDVVTALCEDAEGSLWVGTQDGLSQLSDVKFPIYSSREGWADGAAVSVAASPRGGVWVGTTQGVSYFDGKKVTRLPPVGGSRYMRRVFEARNGDLYLGDGDKNILLVRDARVVRRWSGDGWPEAFAEDDEGVMVGIGTTLYRLREHGLEPYRFAGSPPEFYWITNLLRTRDGALWVACNHGVVRIEGGRFRHWSVADGLSSDKGTALMEDSDGSVWVALGTGLARIKDGVVTNVRTADGLYDDRIYAIVPDDHDSYWMASGRGYFRVPRHELRDLANRKITKVTCEPFDGLNAVKFADRDEQGNMGCKVADGTIWFPTPHGALRIDPAAQLRNEVPPPVHIESVTGDEAPPAELERGLLRTANHRIEFRFAVLSYIQPKRLRVRYRLEGLDEHWMEAGERRVVRYDNLSPGRYRFQVQAANVDGVWNRAGATHAFELPPPFYQTGWFYSLCSAAAVGLLVGAARWNTRRVQRAHDQLQLQNQMLERRVAERTDALARSLAQLKATLDATAEGILALQIADGKVTGISCNAQFTAMWRLPEGALHGGAPAVRDFLAAQVREAERFRQRMMELAAAPGAEAQDFLELNDGRVFEWHCRPQRIEGRIVGLVVDVRDVTERRRAEAELAYERDLLRALMDSASDQICFKDRESRFLKVSQARARNCGFSSPDQLVGQTDFAIFTAAHAQETLADEQEVMRTGRALVGKVERETWADGHETWALTSRIPLRDRSGAIIGTIGISKDLTQLKLAEAKLEQVHRQLLETSRQAGMAEVATSVLHNVGNALTSVNVSATFVAELARRSKVSYLPKLSAVLSEHEADLTDFLTNDPKGRRLPAFLVDLTRELLSEQTAQLEELARLTEHLEHIKNIVAMQQNYAKIAGVSETVKITQIVEDAVRMNASALTRHHIELVRDYQFEPVVTIERHKVLQILVNLISNAKYACDEARRADKRVIVRTEASGAGVAIKVIDNGVGIAPENLTRIFGHGFTTKKDGHGFALHSGSLLAGELGGELRAESAGPGTGATFTLQLPLSLPSDPPSAG
jgi:PAS domain S-box-containing protein